MEENIKEKNICANVVQKAREIFMSEKNVKLLADNFEKEAAKALEKFLLTNPNEAFNTTFELAIEYSMLDFVAHRCPVYDVSTAVSVDRLEPFNLENPQFEHVTSDENSSWYDIHTSSLKWFISEIIQRGYNVGFYTGTDLVVYIKVDI